MIYTDDDFKKGKVLLIDKPIEWTSFQVVNKLRWNIKKHFNIKKIKVGHAGTLDPLATGLLIICTGKQTKNINQYQSLYKEYTGAFTIGSTTPSYDLETKINKKFSIDHITKKKLEEGAEKFLGKIKQKPPIFSAIKKDGKRLYEFARKGKNVKIEPREVEIFKFEIIKISLPKVFFRIVCSKGTYIRSLANDFGKVINSGAHLSALRRTKIGDFTIENSITIQEFINSLESPPVGYY